MPLNGLISLSATVILSIYILSVTTFIILLKINFINLFDVQIYVIGDILMENKLTGLKTTDLFLSSQGMLSSIGRSLY